MSVPETKAAPPLAVEIDEKSAEAVVAAVRSTPPLYTAVELAAMPATQARAALVAQECAHMNQHHARRLLQEVPDELEYDFEVGRVTCMGIEGRTFTWEAWEACGLCWTTGEILGADSKLYDCPNCKDLIVETFSTDYDGNLLKGDA